MDPHGALKGAVGLVRPNDNKVRSYDLNLESVVTSDPMIWRGPTELVVYVGSFIDLNVAFALQEIKSILLTADPRIKCHCLHWAFDGHMLTVA